MSQPTATGALSQQSAGSDDADQATPAHDKVFVVIPAFNEAPTIADLVGRATAQVRNVIVVDDGSGDGTADRIAATEASLIRHAANRGKGASLVTGIGAALDRGASAVVTLDGDGQHRPEDIPAFLERARTAPGCIVVGCRLGDPSSMPAKRYRANKIANFWISWACGYRVADSQCGFRLYPRAVLEALAPERSRHRGFVFESEILIKAARLGFRSVPVRIPALYGGEAARASHFRPVADITRIVLMVAWQIISRGMYPQGLFRMLHDKEGAV